MRSRLIILGCGNSTGVPRIDGHWGNCNKRNKKNLRTRCSAILIKGSNFIRPINYFDNKIASAQCKSSVMLAALLAPGQTQLKCNPSRNHTELLFKHLKIPIKINKKKKN